MGAAEQQRIDLGVDDRSEQALGEHVHLFGIGLASLDELDEPGAGGTGELDVRRGQGGGLLVGAASDGADGADHPDSVGVGDRQHRSQAGLDDTDHRDVDAGLELVEGDGGGGVAGDDDQLRVEVLDHPVGDLMGEGSHLVVRTRPVGIPPGVAEVDEILTRRQVDQRTRDGQTSEPGVEHRNRTIGRHGHQPQARSAPPPR